MEEEQQRRKQNLHNLPSHHHHSNLPDKVHLAYTTHALRNYVVCALLFIYVFSSCILFNE